MNYKHYIKATRQILHQSQQEKFPYLVEALGRKFIIRKNVFSPKYFHDTEIFAEHLLVEPNEDLLEIGCGSGIISVIKALQGVGRIVAIDINHEAVKNTRDNALKHGVLNIIDVRQGHLFRPLKKNERFDVIFWNAPFGLIETTAFSTLEKAVFDHDYKAIGEFLQKGLGYLKPKGRLVIGFSSTLGKTKKLKQLCRNANLNLELIYKQTSEEKYSVQFELFEARPCK